MYEPLHLHSIYVREKGKNNRISAKAIKQAHKPTNNETVEAINCRKLTHHFCIKTLYNLPW